jgi:hypothetical protein
MYNSKKILNEIKILLSLINNKIKSLNKNPNNYYQIIPKKKSVCYEMGKKKR